MKELLQAIFESLIGVPADANSILKIDPITGAKIEGIVIKKIRDVLNEYHIFPYVVFSDDRKTIRIKLPDDMEKGCFNVTVNGKTFVIRNDKYLHIPFYEMCKISFN